jgi:hypothetical protein
MMPQPRHDEIIATIAVSLMIQPARRGYRLNI